MRDMVVLINLDSAACNSLARRLRGEQLYCKILPADTAVEELPEQDALGVILCGGVSGEALMIPRLSHLLRAGIPVMALGDAALTLCQYLGGGIDGASSGSRVEQVRFMPDLVTCDVQAGERYLPACRYMTPPRDKTEIIALSDGGALGFRVSDDPVYALTFYPEQNDPDGMRLVINFCRGVCGCTPWWSRQAFVDRACEEIERLSGGGEAVCAISGGIDSAVCAMLGNRSLGHRLHCLFIDTGLMRKDEGDQVMDFFQNQVGLSIKRINAGEEILKTLTGVVGAENKQRVVFAHMRAILRREVSQMPNVRLILQGTNYADTLDDEPPFAQEMTGAHVRIIEPLRELFKNEIRFIGEGMQLPDWLVRRQPFPASGLALRIASDVTEQKLSILREADAIFRREIEAAGLNRRLFQYYVVLMDNPVPEDGCFLSLRAVQLVGEAAEASRLPNDFLERTTRIILDKLPGVRRVMYDLTPSRSYKRWRSE